MNSTFEIANVTGYDTAGTVLPVASCAARMPALLQRPPAIAPISSAAFIRNGRLRPMIQATTAGTTPEHEGAEEDRRQRAARHRRQQAGARVDAQDRDEDVEAEVLEQLPRRLGIRAAKRRVAGAQRAERDPGQQQADRRANRQLDAPPIGIVIMPISEPSVSPAASVTMSVLRLARTTRARLARKKLDARVAAGDAQDVPLAHDSVGPDGHLLAGAEHRVQVQAVAAARRQLAQRAAGDAVVVDDDVDGLRADVARLGRVDLGAEARRR